ncbi:cell wall protein [Streptomyces sp. NPDC005878]|uniref:cell wall protein n=1 Tax=Streptomyces sp. NPDC005878 TaxID=3157077 RepID=UPI0033D97E8A
MAWLIAAGHHPRATATTLRVAEDLADRMDYTTGHVRYCLEETAARLGMSKATVKRQVAVLRELGALAWVVHGTRANIRRALGLAGYAGTATVYAAVIPPSYDHAMGHRIIGTGYTARIVVDLRRSPDADRHPVDNAPVDNQAVQGGEPPSLYWVKEEGQVKAMGGVDRDTSRERASRRTPRIPQPQSSSKAPRRSPMQVARDIQIARQVRPLVTWTQREGLRRLAFALRPLIDRGLDARAIAGELVGLCTGWHPARPAAFITARLADERSEVRHAPEQPPAAAAPNAAFCAARQTPAAVAEEHLVEHPQIEEQPLSEDEKNVLRELAVGHPSVILQYAMGYGIEATIELYGRLAVENAFNGIPKCMLPEPEPEQSVLDNEEGTG